jgi:polysaccharide pyruvyl transferase WcaK-like protein
MKILFVGDNRSGVNWGRGASIALSQLLSGSFQITGRVMGDLFVLGPTGPGYVNTLIPAHFAGRFQRVLLNPHPHRLLSLYVRLEKFFGAKDFISEDPSESVNNLIAHRHQHPALDQIYAQAVAADVMVLDGDGDIVFATPPRRTTLFLLAMIELGVRLNKPVFLVNSMISDCPATGCNPKTLAAATKLFAQCRAVALRDPESLEYVRKKMPAVNSSYIPDSLFAWYPYYANEKVQPPANGDFFLPHPEEDEHWGKLDFSRPYILIGGGAAASSQPRRSIECYKGLVDAVKELGYAVYLTENDFPDNFLREVAREKQVGIIPVNTPILMCGAVLARARLFISGRYHPSIFASLGGTPCIFLASHAHKMGSLGRVLEHEAPRQFSAFPDAAELVEIVAMAKSYLDQGETLRQQIKETARRRCEEVLQLPVFIKSRLD